MASNNAAVHSKHLFRSGAAADPSYNQFPDHRDSIELQHSRGMSSTCTTSTSSGLFSRHSSKKASSKTITDSHDSLLLHTVATKDLDNCKCPRRHQEKRLDRIARKFRKACAATTHACKVAGHHIRDALSEPYGDVDVDKIQINTHSSITQAEFNAELDYKIRCAKHADEQVFGQQF